MILYLSHGQYSFIENRILLNTHMAELDKGSENDDTREDPQRVQMNVAPLNKTELHRFTSSKHLTHLA